LKGTVEAFSCVLGCRKDSILC